MNARLLTFALPLASLLLTAASLRAADQTAQSISLGELHYLLALPADYDQQPDKKWPLVLFLHGAGERGSDLEKVKVHGPPKQVAAGKSLPFVVVSPQCPTGERWTPYALAKLVDAVAEKHRVDRQRLYVTGLSMGGAGTWSLLAEYPEKFAAAISICGRGDLEAAERIAKTPVRVFVGAKDRERTVANCFAMTAALKQAGGDAELKLYPDLPHDCWTVTYDDPEVWQWLLSHSRPAKEAAQ
jgi:predicted peptidase